MKYIFTAIVIVAMLSCKQEKPKNVLELGLYRATLQVSDSETFPFYLQAQ